MEGHPAAMSGSPVSVATGLTSPLPEHCSVLLCDGCHQPLATLQGILGYNPEVRENSRDGFRYKLQGLFDEERAAAPASQGRHTNPTATAQPEIAVTGVPASTTSRRTEEPRDTLSHPQRCADEPEPPAHERSIADRRDVDSSSGEEEEDGVWAYSALNPNQQRFDLLRVVPFLSLPFTPHSSTTTAATASAAAAPEKQPASGEEEQPKSPTLRARLEAPLTTLSSPSLHTADAQEAPVSSSGPASAEPHSRRSLGSFPTQRSSAGREEDGAAASGAQLRLCNSLSAVHSSRVGDTPSSPPALEGGGGLPVSAPPTPEQDGPTGPNGGSSFAVTTATETLLKEEKSFLPPLPEKVLPFRFTGAYSPEHSFFLGYQWQCCQCKMCGKFVGWGFAKETEPPKTICGKLNREKSSGSYRKDSEDEDETEEGEVELHQYIAPDTPPEFVGLVLRSVVSRDHFKLSKLEHVLRSYHIREMQSEALQHFAEKWLTYLQQRPTDILVHALVRSYHQRREEFFRAMMNGAAGDTVWVPPHPPLAALLSPETQQDMSPEEAAEEAAEWGRILALLPPCFAGLLAAARAVQWIQTPVIGERAGRRQAPVRRRFQEAHRREARRQADTEGAEANEDFVDSVLSSHREESLVRRGSSFGEDDENELMEEEDQNLPLASRFDNHFGVPGEDLHSDGAFLLSGGDDNDAFMAIIPRGSGATPVEGELLEIFEDSTVSGSSSRTSSHSRQHRRRRRSYDGEIILLEPERAGELHHNDDNDTGAVYVMEDEY